MRRNSLANSPVVLLPLVLLGGCIGVVMGRSDSSLIRTAAADNDCPRNEISVVGREQAPGSGQYVLDVCGTEVKYRRTGAVYSLVPSVPCDHGQVETRNPGSVRDGAHTVTGTAEARSHSERETR